MSRSTISTFQPVEDACIKAALSDSDIVVVTDSEEIIASDREIVDEYIHYWGPFDPYLRLRSEVE